jgi:hypothetical protein
MLWPDIKFPPVNLYSIPRTKVEYKEVYRNGKKVYRTYADVNELYLRRARG